MGQNGNATSGRRYLPFFLKIKTNCSSFGKNCQKLRNFSLRRLSFIHCLCPYFKKSPLPRKTSRCASAKKLFSKIINLFFVIYFPRMRTAFNKKRCSFFSERCCLSKFYIKCKMTKKAVSNGQWFLWLTVFSNRFVWYKV